MSFKEAAKQEYENQWQEQLATYVRLVEVSKRAIEIEKQNIANYEAKIGILRESLRNLESAGEKGRNYAD